MYYVIISDDEGTKFDGRATYPGALSQAVEAKLIGDLGSVHGILAHVSH
jgi:hypothetical protein